jgi:transposase
MSDWLPEGHLVYFILDVVGGLDLSRLEAEIQRKDSRGERPYHPRMMVGLLIYGYCTGVYSSRRMARSAVEDVAFRVLSGDSQPHFTTINEFRRTFRNEFAELFLQVLQLCQKAGLVKLGHVSVDGTKVKANASKHKAMSYERMVEEEARLKAEIEELQKRGDAQDVAEDQRYGTGNEEFELPQELSRREERLKRIEEARRALEDEAKAKRAEALRKQAENIRKSAKEEDRDRYRRGLESRADTVEKKAEELSQAKVEEGHEEPAATDLPLRTGEVNTDGTPAPKSQKNFTDPESYVMKSGSGFIQAYNAQAVVDDSCQVIVAADVTNQPPDNGNLAPMLRQTVSNCGGAPAKASADAGYWNPLVSDMAQELGIDPFVATGRENRPKLGEPAPAKPPDGAGERQKMKAKLASPGGHAIYARRKAIVEPVFGQIKGRAFRAFSFRGLVAVRAEWSLVCACHNLLKLYRHGPKEANNRLTMLPRGLHTLLWRPFRLAQPAWVPQMALRKQFADSSSQFAATYTCVGRNSQCPTGS